MQFRFPQYEALTMWSVGEAFSLTYFSTWRYFPGCTLLEYTKGQLKHFKNNDDMFNNTERV
jgi:hypothetical protein